MWLIVLHSCGVIWQLEDDQHLAAQDLKYASSTIQADLDRFQRQKVADIREMALAMATIHRDWAKAVCRLHFLSAGRCFLHRRLPVPDLSEHGSMDGCEG
jgi:hypothetical protein